jgi:hypothetical protein
MFLTFRGFGLVERHTVLFSLTFSFLCGIFNKNKYGNRYHFFAGTFGTELQKSYILQLLQATIFVPVYKLFVSQ